MDDKLVMAVIAGANEALKYKEKNSRAENQEVLKFVASKAKRIIKDID